MRLYTTVTFTFTDHQGTRRWVQRVVAVDKSEPAEVGQSTRLWCDPDKPGDTRSIVVEAVRDNKFHIEAR